jgi:putative ABC transport system permease protein
MGLALLCAVGASLVPAWHASRSDSASALREDPSSRGGKTFRGLLTSSQLALSLVLLVGAALLGRAFISLRSVPLGFEPDQTLAMQIALQAKRFGPGTAEETRARRLTFYQQLTESIRQLPGVQSAGAGLPAPFSGMSMVQRYSGGVGEPERQAEAVISLAGYLETLKVSLVDGRRFTKDDDHRPFVILDERIASELWPSRSAIGRQILLFSSKSIPRPVEVVGVVKHVQTRTLRGAGPPQIWVSYGLMGYTDLDLVVRHPDPHAIVAAVKEVVQRLGAGRPVHDVRLVSEDVAAASADTRFALFVLGAFAVLAVSLTAIGVYAVVAYATARRMREIAVRMALGADAPRIVALVVREGASWIVSGLLVGVVAARMLTRYVGTLLFNVTPTDVATFAGVAAALTVIALLAVAVPALRAVKVNPMVALKAE